MVIADERQLVPGCSLPDKGRKAKAWDAICYTSGQWFEEGCCHLPFGFSFTTSDSFPANLPKQLIQ